MEKNEEVYRIMEKNKEIEDNLYVGYPHKNAELDELSIWSESRITSASQREQSRTQEDFPPQDPKANKQSGRYDSYKAFCGYVVKCISNPSYFTKSSFLAEGVYQRMIADANTFDLFTPYIPEYVPFMATNNIYIHALSLSPSATVSYIFPTLPLEIIDANIYHMDTDRIQEEGREIKMEEVEEGYSGEGLGRFHSMRRKKYYSKYSSKINYLVRGKVIKSWRMAAKICNVPWSTARYWRRLLKNGEIKHLVQSRVMESDYKEE